MNRSLLPLVATLASLACADSPATAPSSSLAGAAEVQQDRSSGRCRNVEGTIVEAITGANTAAGVITGDFAGDVSIVITSLTPSGQGGAMHFEGICTIVTPQGTITTHDAAVLAPIDAPLFRVNNRLTVVGGTGAYAGATGELHTHGTANFVPGGLVDLRYEGRVCDAE